MILGYSFETVAKTFQIGVTTVKDIVKRKDAIMTAISMDHHSGTKRKVVRLGRKPDVEEMLYMYLVEKTGEGEMVSNKELLEQASVYNKEIYNEDWTPSSGWLKKFKNRYCIGTKTVYENSMDVCDEETISDEEIEENDELQLLESESDQVKNSTTVSSVSVLNACDILLDFMSEYDFPLKEIITLRVVKDKISKMPESQTLYEVHNNTNNSESQQSEPGKFEVISIEGHLGTKENVNI